MHTPRFFPTHLLPFLDALLDGRAPVGLAYALWRQDPDTFLHGLRVAQLTSLVADALCVEAGERDRAALGAFLHDVGKLKVDLALLRKPAEFTRSEYETMQGHAAWGHDLLSEAGKPALAAVALAHHERWDGQGYPHGLKGSEIPLAARITSVTDAFDAMTHDRPYRRALPLETAFAELQSGRGTQFAPEVVEAFRWSEVRVLALAG